MKEIIVNVDNYNENSIKTIEGDNLSEVYKIYICKNKRRIDLTNKIAVMAYVDEYGSKRSNILNLNITNAAEGEIELPITNIISEHNGVYACQVAIYGENNSLEQTAPFSLIVENNIFSKISNAAINSSDFHILIEAIKTASEYAKKLKDGTEKIELQYADELNKKANKADLVSNRRFQGSDITANILSKNNVNGDYWYSTDEKVYYLKSEEGWINIGYGDNMINNIVSVLESIEEKNKYLQYDGRIISDAPSDKFKITTFTVVENEKYEVSSTYVGKQRMYCFYDSNNEKIIIYPNNVMDLQETSETIVIKVPKNAVKLVVSSYNRPIRVIKLPVTELNSISDIKQELKNINDSIKNVQNMQNMIELEKVNKYIGSNGKILNLKTDNFAFKELNVKECERFRIKGKCTGWQRLYSFMDENDNVISVYPDVIGSISTTPYDTIVTVPKNAVKLNVSSSYDFINNITTLPILTLPTQKQTSNNEKIVFNSNYEYALSKIICIGDSLMSGATYTEAWGENASPGASIDQNIPRFLERMLNCKTTNAGKSGWSASDWYRDYIIPGTYNFSEYDSALIWLGTNYGCDAMPSDEEIESFIPTSVPLGQANTANQAQYLIKIIKEIKKANSDCYIMLCTCFASKSNLTNNNNVLAQIAEKYSCHLIDMSDLGLKEHPELHGGVQNVHFGKAGNIFVASRIINSVKEKMLSNPLACEFGYTPRTN
ncbi:SGNH/GDSL hydrolase family protein [Clostridium perfringens]|uniref:SGNH/GDSL hydrolase family protein n=5 Tax=Clostridium perfringens TaxID=1502 RepID=UPI001C852F42|nr:SGNH/GDSL hydrolase family protein [Clostridium perfringens]EJT6169353.1 BppU family phage baseplate upper protein [Clostridium perfringens]EJT6622424.1 BppU family phage baseplate upper protein [Clostridium perfringens]UCR75239.1 neck passage structure protein [Clostridium phage vB_CpeS_BG3P]